MQEYIRFTKNPKNETNDCIIRSIANAEDREWVDVMREMCDLAISMYNMPNAYEVNQDVMNKISKSGHNIVLWPLFLLVLVVV